MQPSVYTQRLFHPAPERSFLTPARPSSRRRNSFHVVDGHAHLAGNRASAADGGENRVGARQIRERAVQHAAAVVRPQEMYVVDAERRREPDQRLHVAQRPLQQHHRDAGPQAGGDGRPNSFRDALERSGASDGIVGRRRGTIEADLDAQAVPGERGEAIEPLAAEQRAIGENHELTLVLGDNPAAQLEQVRAGEWLSTGDEEPLRAQCDPLIDRVQQAGGRQSLGPIGA